MRPVSHFLRHERPLHTRRESSATTSAKARVLDVIDDLFPALLKNFLGANEDVMSSVGLGATVGAAILGCLNFFALPALKSMNKEIDLGCENPNAIFYNLTPSHDGSLPSLFNEIQEMDNPDTEQNNINVLTSGEINTHDNL